MSRKRIPIAKLDEVYDHGVLDALRKVGPNPGKCTIWEPQLGRMYRAGYDEGSRMMARPSDYPSLWRYVTVGKT